MSNVVSIGVKGNYTDFRVLVRDMMEKYPEVKDGILILFDEADGMCIKFICKQSFLSWAGADLLHKSATDDMESL